MKKTLIALLVVCTLTFAAFGQKLGKPTLTPSPLTSSQQKTLQEAVVLHDAKKYAEAIVKYKVILAENPDATGAMYELAFSLNAKGDQLEAMELANKGTKYISDELPLFYLLMANNLDDLGKSDDAIKIYQDGIKHLEGKSFAGYRSSLQYNLGVTYVKRKKYLEARQALKSAVENNFAYASPHYLLSVVYSGTKYRVPAFLAASRFLTLEFNTQRSANTVDLITEILKPAAKDAKTGNINILLDLNAPKDEGDFGMFDLLLGTLTTIKGDDDKNKTDNQMFVDAIGTIISILGEDKKVRSTFVGKAYVPFMVEMKKSGHVEAFGNMVLFLKDRTNPEAAKWINDNSSKVDAMLTWAKAYTVDSK